MKNPVQELMQRYMRKPVEIDEFELARAAERGAQAEELLRNEALRDAFQDVESVYLGAWRNSGGHEIELRERSWIAISLLSDVRNALINRVREGKAANEKLTRLLNS